MATRTGTTRTTSSALSPSADRYANASHADFSFRDVVEAYFDCRRRKLGTYSALLFERRREPNLIELFDELQAGAWRPGKSICFVVERPKIREVWAASFRDRIVHHLLYNRIRARFENAFIVDTCACIEAREEKSTMVGGGPAQPDCMVRARTGPSCSGGDALLSAGEEEGEAEEEESAMGAEARRAFTEEA